MLARVAQVQRSNGGKVRIVAHSAQDAAGSSARGPGAGQFRGVAPARARRRQPAHAARRAGATASPPKQRPTRNRPTRPTPPAASPPIDAPRSSSSSSAQGQETMDDSEFHRLKRLPPYVFAEVNAMKARARAAGQDVIDLGMGNPDLPTAPHIVAKLAEAAANPRAHGYSASRGIPGLRKAQAAYYAAPLRRRARSRERDHRHAGLEGRPRQSRAGDHLAGRHRAGAQPQLSDPSLRLHHRRRLGAPHPGAGHRPRSRSSCRRSSARCATRCPSRSRWC